MRALRRECLVCRDGALSSADCRGTWRDLTICASPSCRQLWRRATAIATTCGQRRRGTRSRLPTSSEKRSSGWSSRTTSFRSARVHVKLRRACGKEPQRTWTKLLPPPLGVELLFGSSGVFEVIDRCRRTRSWISRMARTSGIATRARVLACRNAGGLGRPRVRVWVMRRRAGMCPRGCERGSVDRGEEATWRRDRV